MIMSTYMKPIQLQFTFFYKAVLSFIRLVNDKNNYENHLSS